MIDEGPAAGLVVLSIPFLFLFQQSLTLSLTHSGLFHKAIMADGSALSPWAMAYDPITYSRKLAVRVGCPDEPEQNSVMVDCLRQKSARELVNAETASPKHLTNMGPTVDGIVLPNDPLSLMDTYSSVFANYDLLLGVSKVPYYDFSAVDERQGIESGRKERILRTLVRNLYTYHLQVSPESFISPLLLTAC